MESPDPSSIHSHKYWLYFETEILDLLELFYKENERDFIYYS